jgi:hypothetical protein
MAMESVTTAIFTDPPFDGEYALPSGKPLVATLEGRPSIRDARRVDGL